VLVTAPLAQLTPSGPTMPLTDIRTVPVSRSGPATLALPHGNAKPAESILAALLSTLADFPAPPLVVLADETATELPEPGSLAMLMLTLIIIGLVRLRDQRRVRKA